MSYFHCSLKLATCACNESTGGGGDSSNGSPRVSAKHRQPKLECAVTFVVNLPNANVNSNAHVDVQYKTHQKRATGTEVSDPSEILNLNSSCPRYVGIPGGGLDFVPRIGAPDNDGRGNGDNDDEVEYSVC